MRKRFFFLCLFIILFFNFPALTYPQTKLQRIIAAYPSPNVQYLAAYVAREKGIYRDEGLNVQLVSMRGAKEAVQALLGGDIQFIMTIGPELPAIWKGLDLKILAQQVGAPTFSLVVPPDIKNINQLKGKNIGVSFGGSTFAGIKALFEKYKIDEASIKYINIPGSSPKVSAMQQGLISAALLAPPADLMALKAGFKRLIYLGDEFKNYAFTGLATTGKILQENPDMVKKMVRATVKSVLHTKNNPSDAIEVMQKFLRMDMDSARATYEVVRDSFSPVLTYDGINNMAQWQVVALGISKPPIPPEKYTDLRFLNEVLKELGLAK